ncbi:MAG: hypothetical protein WAK93_08800 [Solirubrobacteraceae bacterium]
MLSLVLALLAAIWSVEKISLIPPGLSSRSGLEMATAHTEVLVDTPQSIMTNLRENSYSIDGLVNRAVVLGNVIASTPVEARIAQRANVPAALLRIQAPITVHVASLPLDSQDARSMTDILKSNEQYRIAIEASPTVPMLDIYAQTPTAESAAALANAAVDELKAYVSRLASSQATPANDQIRIEQLGRATGLVINPGVKYQVALLVFILTFLLACATTIFTSRIRAGWRLEELSDRTARA